MFFFTHLHLPFPPLKQTCSNITNKGVTEECEISILNSVYKKNISRYKTLVLLGNSKKPNIPKRNRSKIN